MLGLIIVLIVVGVVLTFIPMDASIKKIVIALIALVVLFIVLREFAPGALSW